MHRRWILVGAALVAVVSGVVWSTQSKRAGEELEGRSLVAREAPAGWRWHREDRFPDGFYGLIRTSDEWEAFVAQRPALERVLSDINWREELLLVAYLGTAPTGGFAVHIDRVEVEEGELVARLTLRSPAPDEIVTMAFTHPADAVVLPRDALPAAVTTDEDALTFVTANGEAFHGDFVPPDTEDG